MSTQIRIRREQDKKFQRTTDATEADVVPWTNPGEQVTNVNMCYFCQKCKNHGILMWKKVIFVLTKYFMILQDHKKNCQFANCRCEQCDLIDTRRALDRHIKSQKDAQIGKKKSDKNKTSESNTSSSTSSINSPVDVESLIVPNKSVAETKVF